MTPTVNVNEHTTYTNSVYLFSVSISL